MSYYVTEFDPDAHGTPLQEVEVRLAGPGDLPACGALLAQREGGDPAVWALRLERSLGADHPLFVAVHDGRVLGYGRVARLTPTASGGRNAADGWYLSGVVIDRDHRRRGLARSLTRARCAWVWERADSVYYVVNALHEASRRLHGEFGFQEVTRDFDLPGVYFTEGHGILCRADARTSSPRETLQRDLSAQRENVVELSAYATR